MCVYILYIHILVSINQITLIVYLHDFVSSNMNALYPISTHFDIIYTRLFDISETNICRS